MTTRLRIVNRAPAIDDDQLARDGRLFTLKLRRSAEARRDALATVRERPDGQWQARIGGRMRGRTELFPSKAAAQLAINAHYDRALQETMLRATSSRR